MATTLIDPDLKASLRLDAHAPRAARYYVAQVDRPAPDLRDAAVLLTSELVTRAVQQCQSEAEEVELRVWMPNDVVRVELRARRELLCLPLDDRDAPQYDVMLLGQVADRWSIDTRQHPACMWFEIDRHTSIASPNVPGSTRADAVSRRLKLFRRPRGAGRAL
jgi:hypothetical protein